MNRFCDDTTICRYDDTTIQRFDNTTIRRYDDATIQRFDDTTIRRFDDMTIRRYNDTTTGRYDDRTVRRCDDKTMQCEDTMIQQWDHLMIRRKELRCSRLMYWPFTWAFWVCSSALVNASLLCNYSFKQVRRKGWTARWLSQRKWAIIFGQTDTTCSSWSAIMWVKLDHHALLRHALAGRLYTLHS